MKAKIRGGKRAAKRPSVAELRERVRQLEAEVFRLKSKALLESVEDLINISGGKDKVFSNPAR